MMRVIRAVQAWRSKISFSTLSYIICVSMLSGCAHYSRFDKSLSGQQCEKAVEAIPNIQWDSQVIGRTKQTFGHIASYAATGVGYATDFVVLVVGGLVTAVVLCAPMMAANMSTSSQGNAARFCIDMANQIVTSPEVNYKSLGNNAYKATESIRCHDMTWFSSAIRKISSCYLDRGNSGDLEKAEAQIRVISENDQLMKCLDKKEQVLVSDLQSKIYGSKVNWPKL